MVYKHRPIKPEKSKDILHLADYDNLLVKRRGFPASAFRKNEDVVLLLSGGLDSIGLWIYLLSKFQARVFPLYLYRNGLNTSPYRAIQYYENLLKSRFPENFQPVKVQKTNSPLFIYSRLKRDFSAKLNLHTMLHNLSYDPDKKKYVPVLPNQPSRLGIFVFTAFEYALGLSLKYHREIGKIVYALTPEEDMIRGSELPLIRLFSLTLCELTRDNHWEVLAPIDKPNGFYLKKRQLVDYCFRLGLNLDRTWSCGKSDRYHCGSCFNCFHRKKAFHEAGIEDRTLYRPSKLRHTLSHLYWKWQRFKFNLLKNNDKSTIPNTFSLTKKIHVNPHLQWLKEKNKLYIFNETRGYIEEFEGSGVGIWDLLVKKPQSPTEIIRKKIQDKQQIITFLRQVLKDNYVMYE